MKVIYTIPGLGTTKDLFKHISVPNYQLKVLDWPQPQLGWTLKQYAKAFIDQIDTSEPVNLCGVSFGGMLCCEIADLIKTEKIILISSCKNRNELPPTIKLLKTLPVQKIMSDKLYRSFAEKLSWAVGFQKDYLPEFLAMMNSMPPDYFKYCIDMIVNWDKTTNAQTIHHMHGNADTLLPHSYIKNYESIAKGNHAMIVYKAAEINASLNKLLNGL